MGNRSKEFVNDLWALLRYQKEKRFLTGRCGKVICSKEYMDRMERQVFGKAQGWVLDCESYYGEVYGGLNAIAVQINLELNFLDGYLTEERAESLKTVFRDMEKCGLKLGDLYRKVDAAVPLKTKQDRSFQIRRLQKNLNEMLSYGGISGGSYIKEDGEYGHKTHELMQSFLMAFAKGVPPRLKVDYLNRESSGLSIEYHNSRQKPPLGSEVYRHFDLSVVPDGEFEMPYLFEDIPGKFGEWKDFTYDDGSTVRIREQQKKLVMRPDFPHYFEKDKLGNKIFIDYHMNIEDVDFPQRHPFIKEWVESIDSERIKGKNGGHIIMSESSYSFFKNLKGLGTVVKILDRMFLVYGIIADTIRLYEAIMKDIKDDGKIGWTTERIIVEIGAEWAFSALFASIGLTLGALYGPIPMFICGILFGALGTLFGKVLADLSFEVTGMVVQIY